jgi:hypothetical protein
MRHRGRFRRGPADPAHRPEPIAGDLASDETQIRLIAVCGTDRLLGIICLRADLEGRRRARSECRRGA